MKKATLAASVVLACAAMASHAQAVYRCGNEYSQKPCAGGAAVAVGDERSAAQAKDSAAAARRDAKLGTAMEKERLAREKEQGGPTSTVLGQPPKAAPAPVAAASKPGPHAKKKKGKEPEHFSAVAPRPAAEKKKEKAGKKS